MKEMKQLNMLNDKLNKLMLRKSSLQQKSEEFKSKYGTRNAKLTAAQLKAKEVLKEKYKANNADIAKKKAELKKIMTFIKKKGGETTEKTANKHKFYARNFPPEQFKEIDSHYVNKVDTHVTLFTKLFILFIFYLHDLSDNKVDSIGNTDKSLLWMLENNLIYLEKGDDDENHKLNNLHLLINTLNITQYQYTKTFLYLCNHKNINDCEWIPVEQNYIFPSEFVLHVDAKYQKTETINHLVYVSYAKNETNDKGTLHIMDINCSNKKNTEKFNKRFQQYFEPLINNYDNIEEVIFSHSTLQVPRHTIILNDMYTLSQEFKTNDKREGLCGYMSIFSHFLLSYETKKNKSRINKILDRLSQVRFNDKKNLLFSWFTKNNNGNKDEDINEYKKLLRGRPNKDNFIKIVNILKENKLKTIEQLEKEDPILELYCPDYTFKKDQQNQSIYGYNHLSKLMINKNYYSSKNESSINPCDGTNPEQQFGRELYNKIITYILEMFSLNKKDPLFFETINYYLLNNSIFIVSKTEGKITITQKIFDNEYKVCIIKYLKLQNEKQEKQKKQNAVNLNNYLTNYIASYLIGHIINKERSLFTHKIKFLDYNLKSIKSFNKADDATKKVFKNFILTIRYLLDNNKKKHLEFIKKALEYDQLLSASEYIIEKINTELYGNLQEATKEEDIRINKLIYTSSLEPVDQDKILMKNMITLMIKVITGTEHFDCKDPAKKNKYNPIIYDFVCTYTYILDPKNEFFIFIKEFYNKYEY